MPVVFQMDGSGMGQKKSYLTGVRKRIRGKDDGSAVEENDSGKDRPGKTDGPNTSVH